MSKSIEAAQVSPPQTGPAVARNLLRTIATDIHFWIPLIVLVGGFLLLNELR